MSRRAVPPVAGLWGWFVAAVSVVALLGCAEAGAPATEVAARPAAQRTGTAADTDGVEQQRLPGRPQLAQRTGAAADTDPRAADPAAGLSVDAAHNDMTTVDEPAITAETDDAVKDDTDFDADAGDTGAADLSELDPDDPEQDHLDPDHAGETSAGAYEADSGTTAPDTSESAAADAATAEPDGGDSTGDLPPAHTGGTDPGSIPADPDDDADDASAVGVEGPAATEVRYVRDGLGGVLVEGPCGWIGPLCPADESVPPIEQGGRLTVLDPSKWDPWVGRVLDMCNDHEALVAVSGTSWVPLWYEGDTRGLREVIDYSIHLYPGDLYWVNRERERIPIVCSDADAAIARWICPREDNLPDDSLRLRAYLAQLDELPESSEIIAWAESNGLDCRERTPERRRYVYITRRGPQVSEPSVEAAVDGFLTSVAFDDSFPSDFGRSEVLGYRGWRPPVESPVDSLVLLPQTVRVTDGALRGLAQNHSERQWARDVTVTATDPTGGRGDQWRYPLAVQPGELVPFEIENWTGSRNPDDIRVAISADLSPRIDLGRALGLREYVSALYMFDDLIELMEESYFNDDDFPAEMVVFVDGEADLPTPEGFAEWIAEKAEWTRINIWRAAPGDHPRLAGAALQQTVENLRVFATIRDGFAVVDVIEVTPMQKLPSSTYGSPQWGEARTIPTEFPNDPHPGEYVTIGIVGHGAVDLWAGGTVRENPGTPPPGDETQ